jgi:membrane-bound serine protease (ClpP class)
MVEEGDALTAYPSPEGDSDWQFLTPKQAKPKPPAALDEGERDTRPRKLCDAGEPLVLSAQDAMNFEVSTYVVEDRHGLLIKLRLVDVMENEFREIGSSGSIFKPELGRRIADFLRHPFICFLLILGGIVALFLEFQIPGFGVPGIVGLGCFAIFFGAGLVTGHVSYLELGLFLVSVALIGLEILVIPGFGVAGVLGITGLLLSLLLAMHKGDPEAGMNWADLKGGLFTLVLSISCSIVSIAVCARFLPKNPLIRRAGLVHDADIGGSAMAPADVPAGGGSETSEGTWPVGAVGVAATSLRPAGKARVGDRLLDVVAEADFIDAGTPIIVVKKAGPQTLVRKTEESA